MTGRPVLPPKIYALAVAGLTDAALGMAEDKNVTVTLKQCVALASAIVEVLDAPTVYQITECDPQLRPEAEFRSTKVVSIKTFADVFGLKGLNDVAPEFETKVHICTIQGLVKRVLFTENDSDAPPIDQYDLMVIDECHRGYLLDREMSDKELEFRSQDDYVSKYRRVLEHFDAVKIGLTATPALHTVQIFGGELVPQDPNETPVDISARQASESRGRRGRSANQRAGASAKG